MLGGRKGTAAAASSSILLRLPWPLFLLHPTPRRRRRRNEHEDEEAGGPTQSYKGRVAWLLHFCPHIACALLVLCSFGTPTSFSMRPPCNLQVQVNGQHTFYLTKTVLLDRCGRLARVFQKANSQAGRATTVRCYRMILYDLPGGPEAFELLARFCYSDGNLAITTSNVAMLRCVADYLEMTEEYGAENLIKQTEDFLSNMGLWSWEECLTVLKSCEALLSSAEKTRIIQRCVDSLAVKASSCSSSVSSSPDSLLVPRDSPDTRSSEGHSKCLSTRRRNWWCEDMSSLSMYLMERVVKALVANHGDSKLLAKFLLHYLQASLPLLGYSSVCLRKKSDPDEEIMHSYTQTVQREVLETVVGLLHSLEWASVPCKSMFGLRRVAIVLNASKHCRKQLEEMIGSQLHKATLDNILIPSPIPTTPPRTCCLYDVDLILRLVLLYLQNQVVPSALENSQIIRSCIGSSSTSSPLKTVGGLIDMYLAEIAPDPNLKASKFRELAEALPDNARDSHDSLYRALDIYLEAHPRTIGDEAMEICRVINFQKLSFEACKHITENPRVPARLSFQVLLSQHAKLRAAIDGSLVEGESSSHCSERVTAEDGTSHNSPKLDPATLVRQNEELKSDLQSMQARVVDLEKVCRGLRSQMSKHLRITQLLR